MNHRMSTQDRVFAARALRGRLWCAVSAAFGPRLFVWNVLRIGGNPQRDAEGRSEVETATVKFANQRTA